MQKKGFEIEVWCIESDPELGLESCVQLRIPLVKELYFYWFALAVLLRSWWLYTVCKKPRPDVMYAVAWYTPYADILHLHFSVWDWAERQKQIGTRKVRDCAEWLLTQIAKAWANWAIKTTSTQKILAVSKAVAADVSRIRSDLNISVLPNSYLAHRFNLNVRSQYREGTRQRYLYTEKDTVFLFASMGHYRRKGFFLAVDALHLLRKRGHNPRFHVVGGKETSLAKLKNELDSLYPDWQKWITFVGTTTQMEEHYAACDALLFPSYSEAFALVEVEAAACGLPLFLTPHHGSEMCLQDGVNGRILEFDPMSISNVLEEFVTGQWQLKQTSEQVGLDSDQYAEALIAQIESVARMKRASKTSS